MANRFSTLLLNANNTVTATRIAHSLYRIPARNCRCQANTLRVLSSGPRRNGMLGTPSSSSHGKTGLRQPLSNTGAPRRLLRHNNSQSGRAANLAHHSNLCSSRRHINNSWLINNCSNSGRRLTRLKETLIRVTNTNSMGLPIREESRKAICLYLCTWFMVFFRHPIYKLTMRLTLFGSLLACGNCILIEWKELLLFSASHHQFSRHSM